MGVRSRSGEESIGRRDVLSAATAVVVGGVLDACSKRVAGAAPVPAASAASAPATCALSAEIEEGPFYVDLGVVRSDVRDSEPGAVLDLAVTVVDASTCRPIANAAVDIWSANALGVYSAERREGTAEAKYLRGVQLTDARGVASFRTLYPGSYRGRTNHIHVKVHVGGAAAEGTYRDGAGGHVCHTGQLFFRQADNDAVASFGPYAGNPNEATTNAEDGIYAEQGGAASTLAISGSPAAGFRAAIVVAVDRAAMG